MQEIARYFNRTINELQWDDEDKFMEVLAAHM